MFVLPKIPNDKDDASAIAGEEKTARTPRSIKRDEKFVADGTVRYPIELPKIAIARTFFL